MPKRIWILKKKVELLFVLIFCEISYNYITYLKLLYLPWLLSMDTSERQASTLVIGH